MHRILPFLAMAGTMLATLTAIVACMAAGASASPPEIRALEVWMVVSALLGVAGVASRIVLMRAGHPGRAALAAFAPTVIFVILGVVALVRSGT